LHHQRTGNGDALLLPTRQFGRIVTLPRTQADLAESVFDPTAALCRRITAIAQRHIHVVEQVQIRNQIEALKNETELLVAQTGSLVIIQSAHTDAIQQIVALAELLQQSGDVEEGRLA